MLIESPTLDHEVLPFGTARETAPRILKRIALIGNALPRRCGLATYTSHVADALADRFPCVTVDHWAMDDGTGVAYPAGIRTIAVDDPAAYRAAAGEIEASGADVIWVQHEFGIFGGAAGGYLLNLLERTRAPVVATLHTVLEEPSADEERVFRQLLERASRLIVMAERGRGILTRRWGVAEHRIEVIPHGVPDRALRDPEDAKPRFGFAGRKVVMTFGLLAPDKGVDVMIKALPAIVARHPDLLYLVVGATHPNLVRKHGEEYRDGLVALAERLGVGDHIQFVDSFLDQDELIDLLQAADIFVTPYNNMAQVTSGALSYAIAVGKPIVATPYVHASEALSDDHGVIVPARDPAALSEAVGGLLDEPERRRELSARAYARGREMIWSRFAERSVKVIETAMQVDRRRGVQPLRRAALPVQLDAVERMTDGTGMLQHARFSVPDRNHGYCLDDNARALILTCRAGDAEAGRAARLAPIYAAFVEHCWNEDARRFRNFMFFDRRWCEEIGSEDSNGRGLWALGVTASEAPQRSLRDWAAHLYERAAPMGLELEAMRSQAFAALAGSARLKSAPGDPVSLAALERAGTTIASMHAEFSRPGWTWFEPVLAYDNARLPEALIAAGKALDRTDWRDLGLATLTWLSTQQTGADGSFQPVGCDSFGREYAKPLPFDQQPLEAQATIEACAAAFAATGDARWQDEASRAYRWFLGDNALSLPLAAQDRGGCHDGLMPAGVNGNQGAESLLALQLGNAAISRLPLRDSLVKSARTAA